MEAETVNDEAPRRASQRDMVVLTVAARVWTSGIPIEHAIDRAEAFVTVYETKNNVKFGA